MRDQIEAVRGEVRGEARGAARGGAALREERTLPRRRRTGTGPRPVRPRVLPVTARPVQPARPGRSGSPAHRGERVLLRSVPVLPARVLRRRRVVAAVATALLTAAVVVLLGLLADVAAAARHGDAGGVTGPSLTAVVPSPGQVAGVAGG